MRFPFVVHGHDACTNVLNARHFGMQLSQENLSGRTGRARPIRWKPPRGGSLKQTELHCARDRLRASGDLQFGKDIGEMKLNRALGHAQEHADIP